MRGSVNEHVSVRLRHSAFRIVIPPTAGAKALALRSSPGFATNDQVQGMWEMERPNEDSEQARGA